MKQRQSPGRLWLELTEAVRQELGKLESQASLQPAGQRQTVTTGGAPGLWGTQRQLPQAPAPAAA